MPQNPVTASVQPHEAQRGAERAGFFNHWRRPLQIFGFLIVTLILAGVGVFVHWWPFSRAEIARSLQEDFGARVSFKSFRSVYFPHPGCVIEGLELVRAPGLPPFAFAQRFTLHAAYSDLVFRHGYISSIVLEGLHIQIPPLGSKVSSPQAANLSTDTRVGEVTAKNALLEIARADDRPALKFEIRALRLGSVGLKTQISYDVRLHNPAPPGEIQSRGHFGPWNKEAPAQTPVSGTYQFDDADLGVFHGVAGILSSHDNFQGVLGRIEAHGKVDIPDFRVTRSIHTVHLQAQYDAFVNALNGDVQLPRVESSILQTAIMTSGEVAGHPGKEGKTASLNMAVRDGRIQDLLLLITAEPRPALNGLVNLQAHVEIPPEDRRFLQKLRLTGDFVILEGRFTKPTTQKEIVTLSDRSRGKKPPDNPDAALNQEIQSKIEGRVVTKDGVAMLSNLSLIVPGAMTQVHGTFNLLNERLDFHGALKTDASFSQTAGGVKSVFLKPLDAIFKKKPKGASIPVKLDGTYSDPHPGLDLTGGGKSGANDQRPQNPDKNH